MQASDKKGILAVVVVSILGLGITFTAGESLSDAVIHPMQWLRGPGSNLAFGAAIDDSFGTYDSPKLLASSVDPAAARRLWMQKCSQCHGADGQAKTPTADLLNPRPRDFSEGVVKFVSSRATTEHAPRPSQVDLRRVIREGAPFTSMSAFDELNENELDAIVAYTRWLLIRNASGRAIRGGKIAHYANDIARLRKMVTAQFDAADLPVVDLISKGRTGDVVRGKDLFQSTRAACFTCHGSSGAGDGAAATDENGKALLMDIWGQPAPPRDLRLGQFHGGSTTRAIFSRIQNGIPGTPMPAATALTDIEILDLTAYVLQLRGNL